MVRWLAAGLGLRDGEAKAALSGGGTLFLLIAAHTMLETARDALLIVRLSPNRLPWVYLGLALTSWLATSAAVKLAHHVGRRRALVGSLVVAAYTAAAFFLLRPGGLAILGFYVAVGLFGSVLTTQFWMLVGQRFTVAEGRRLFGLVAAGGVLGAAAGAWAASVVVAWTSVRALPLLAAAVHLVNAFGISCWKGDDPVTVMSGPGLRPNATVERTRAERHYVLRLAAWMVLLAAAAVLVDYLFKVRVAATVPKADVPMFLARYYAFVNGVAFLVQVVVASRLVSALGVVSATAIFPATIFGTALLAMLSGAGLSAVALVKGADAALRNSLQRVVTELLYLPLRGEVRDRTKALLDSVVQRTVQAGLAVVLLSLGALGLDSPIVLCALLTVVCLLALVVSTTFRGPYLALFRAALAEGRLNAQTDAEELDLTSVEALLEALSSTDPDRVLAAMAILREQGRARLIPALILYHDSDRVVRAALETFPGTHRADWVPLAERLLRPPAEDARPARSDDVRTAALLALYRDGHLPSLADFCHDPSPVLRTVAAFHLHQQKEPEPNGSSVSVAPVQLVQIGGLDEDTLLEFVARSGDARWNDVLLAIASRREVGVEPVARAMARHPDPRFVPWLMARLCVRDGRDVVREALRAHGEAARAALESSLRDATVHRRIRLHVPRTLSGYGDQRACDVLVEQLATERDPLVRYKVLRALGRLIVESEHVHPDRARIEAELTRNLQDYLRFLTIHAALASPEASTAERDAVHELLLVLLQDKLRHSLERTFRLLKIQHPREDIHRVYLAFTGTDAKARADAIEFLSVLVAQTAPRATTRELLAIVLEDGGEDARVARARRYLGNAPVDAAAALASLQGDADPHLAAVAAYRSFGTHPQIASRPPLDRPGDEAPLFGFASRLNAQGV